MDVDGGRSRADLDELPVPDPTGWHGVEVAGESDEAVFADVPQVPVGDHIGPCRDGSQCGVVACRADPDDLAVRAVGAGAPMRHPREERRVEFLDRGEPATG